MIGEQQKHIIDKNKYKRQRFEVKGTHDGFVIRGETHSSINLSS